MASGNQQKHQGLWSVWSSCDRLHTKIDRAHCLWKMFTASYFRVVGVGMISGVPRRLLRPRKAVLAECSRHGGYRRCCTPGWRSQRALGPVFSSVQHFVSSNSVPGVHNCHLRVREEQACDHPPRVFLLSPERVFRNVVLKINYCSSNEGLACFECALIARFVVATQLLFWPLFVRIRLNHSVRISDPF